MALWLCSNTRGGEGGRQNVELDNRTVVHSSSRQVALPLDNPRDTDPALPGLGFESAQRAVAGRGHSRGTAVIANEKDEGILLEAMFAQLSQHRADCIIHRGEHCGKRAALLVA